MSDKPRTDGSGVGEIRLDADALKLDEKPSANPNPGPSIFHDFHCTHDPCRCVPNDPEWADVLHLRNSLDTPVVESLRYLVDVFVEGGYAEPEDEMHLTAVHRWLFDGGDSGGPDA